MKGRITRAMVRALRRTVSFLRDRYFSVDARSLGLFRIVFGLHLVANLHDRTRGPDGVAFYTNDGLLPNHYALFAPIGDKIWSLLFPFSTPAEVQIAFLFILVVYALYVVGYRTKLAQCLAVLCLVSLDNRNLISQNGGIVVTNVIAVWTALLPLGARMSVDHLLRSVPERRESTPASLSARAASPERFTRVAFFGLLVNFACIYFFNFAHKRGVTWRDGSAVHWVLWQNRIATIWAAWLRLHEPRWLSPLSTYATLGLEAALPALLLVPVAQSWTRRAAILAILLLHGSIALMMTLGPFSYSMMCFSLLLIGPDDWTLAGQLALRFCPDPWRFRLALARERVERALPRAWAAGAGFTESPAATFVRTAKVGLGQGLACVLLATVVLEVGTDNWIIPDKYRVKRRPEFMREVVEYLRIPQGWSMFSPEAPRDDGTIVIDAVLSDGRHLDPRQQRPPDFEAAFHGPWFDDQQWCDWDLRMRWDSSRQFYPYFRDYIARLDRMPSWKQDARIQSFDVYWVNNASPPPASTRPYDLRRQLLFSGGAQP
jgi:hypothetical protein